MLNPQILESNPIFFQKNIFRIPFFFFYLIRHKPARFGRLFSKMVFGTRAGGVLWEAASISQSESLPKSHHLRYISCWERGGGNSSQLYNPLLKWEPVASLPVWCLWLRWCSHFCTIYKFVGKWSSLICAQCCCGRCCNFQTLLKTPFCCLKVKPGNCLPFPNFFGPLPWAIGKLARDSPLLWLPSTCVHKKHLFFKASVWYPRFVLSAFCVKVFVWAFLAMNVHIHKLYMFSGFTFLVIMSRDSG